MLWYFFHYNVHHSTNFGSSSVDSNCWALALCLPHPVTPSPAREQPLAESWGVQGSHEKHFVCEKNIMYGGLPKSWGVMSPPTPCSHTLPEDCLW